MRVREPTLMNAQHAPSRSTRKVRYEEAARHLGIPLSTLYALVHQKRVPHFRYGPRFVVFDLDELDNWMKQRRVGVETPQPDTDPEPPTGADNHGGRR